MSKAAMNMRGVTFRLSLGLLAEFRQLITLKERQRSSGLTKAHEQALLQLSVSTSKTSASSKLLWDSLLSTHTSALTPCTPRKSTVY